MRVKKGYCKAHFYQEPDKFYVRISVPNINISAGVRDWILPYTHLYIDVKENGDFILIPTNETNGYKVVICNGQAKISCRGLLRQSTMTMTARMYCQKQQDGTILCRTNKVT